MAHSAWIMLHCYVFVCIFLLVCENESLPVMYTYNLIRLSMNYQQLPSEVDEFLFVIEVLLDQATHAAHQTHSHTLYRIKR